MVRSLESRDDGGGVGQDVVIKLPCVVFWSPAFPPDVDFVSAILAYTLSNYVVYDVLRCAVRSCINRTGVSDCSGAQVGWAGNVGLET